MPRLRRRPSRPCQMPNCWQPATRADFCGACYSWWRRVQLLSPGELGLYIKRIGRMGGRVGRLREGAR